MVVYGWDASNHDWQRGPMDFAAARNAGVEFFTHKLTDGLRFYKDPYFARAVTRARAAGIPLLGAYHVLWNGNVTAQMDWFLGELDAQCPWWRAGPFILQLDCEPFGYNGGPPTLGAIRTAADHLVKATGGRYRPIIYAPQWVYRNTLTGLDYPLWASAYGTNPIGGFRDIYPGDASSRWAAYSGQIPAVLQYGSQTRIGSQGTCDANVYRGSLTQLAALVGGKTMTLTAMTTTAAATVTDEEDDMPDQESFQLDPGFACDEAGNFLPGKKALILSRPVDPGAGYTTWVSATCEQGNVRLRVAVDPDGVSGWSVHLVSFDSNGGRANLATLVGLGGNVSIARCKTSATDTDDQTPVGVTFRTGKS